MTEIFLSLEDAAKLEQIKNNTLVQRIKRHPGQYLTKSEANPNGGYPRVMVALSSLTRDAQRKYNAEIRKKGGDAMPKARAPDQEPLLHNL